MNEVKVNYWVYGDGRTSVIITGYIDYRRMFKTPSEAFMELDVMFSHMTEQLDIYYNLDGVGDGNCERCGTFTGFEENSLTEEEVHYDA